MLEILCKKHDLWLKMAKGICKDPYLADDLVSEMYLKVKDYNKDLNDYYIYFAIKHLYINYLREEKHYTSLTDSFNHEEDEQIEYELPNCITWVEKQILLLRQNNSCRDISKQYQIDFNKINRIERGAKLKIQLWLDQKK
jgi:DNA-directed RNA polymerase specialized sigma24 family protein